MSEPDGRARDRFSLIGHAALPFMCPLREDELVSLLDAAALRRGAATLDVGGGRADLSILLARRYGMNATSVDRSLPATELARERARDLSVTCVTDDATAHLAALADGSLALASCVGAVHCFGVRAEGWSRTFTSLARVASRALVADLVATSSIAAEAFEIALLDETDRIAGATPLARLVLDAERVRAYERAWCDAVAARVAAQPDDPRNDWARARIAWADDPSLEEARAALAFVAYVV